MDHIKNKNKNYLLTMCNNITIQLDCSKVWLIFDWSSSSFIRTADPWESIMVLQAAAMQNSVLFYLNNTRYWSICLEVLLVLNLVELMKIQFSFLFLVCPCSLFQFFLRVSSDIGGEIQKLMIVSTCIVWGIWPD